MYVVEVIVLTPASPAAPLSYRSRERLKEGQTVIVPLRKSSVHGIVSSVSEVKDVKAMLKTASFTLARSVTKAEGMIPKPLLIAAESIARYHATSLGAVLHALYSDTLPTDPSRILLPGTGYERTDVETPRNVRERKYRHFIEKNTEDGRATLIVVPTLVELREWKERFIDLDPLVLSGEVEPAVRLPRLNEVVEHKGLVLATPSFSFVPIRALGGIVIERESASSFRMIQRPYLDRARALLMLAEERNVPLLIGDYPLSIELRSRPSAPLSQEPAYTTARSIDLREAREQDEQFRAIPKVLEKEIRAVLKENGRVAVLAARRGYAPSVVCRDCGTALVDEEGGAMSLLTHKGERVLRSVQGDLESAKKLCPHCGSWNLTPLGVGVERIAEELSVLFPEHPVIRFDSDSIKSDSAARKAMALLKKQGSLIAGTEAMLPWIPVGLPKDKKLQLSVVASMDSLLSLPFFRARERFVRIGLTLREISDNIVIGTRRDDSALSAITDPENTAFFKEEAELRKALLFPPFGTLVRVELDIALKRVEALKEELGTMIPEGASVSFREDRGKKVLLMQFPEAVWPHTLISEKLSGLPPSTKVTIDPDSF